MVNRPTLSPAALKAWRDHRKFSLVQFARTHLPDCGKKHVHIAMLDTGTNSYFGYVVFQSGEVGSFYINPGLKLSYWVGTAGDQP